MSIINEAKGLDGLSIALLDHGFVRVVDVMGSDSSVVQAARVSYGLGTKSTSDDERLIRYMMRHKHTSPFEMCEIKLHIKAPIFVARQWLRHRTANVNEYSARYSVLSNEFYYPAAEGFKKQSTSNKQGRDLSFAEEDYEKLVGDMRKLCGDAYKLYEEMLEKGVAREIARMVLPVNVYTEFYWKIDAHNLMHFLNLRCHAHAQEEIRVYALAIRDILAQWMPVTHKAFLDYVVNAHTYSGGEVDLIVNSLDPERFELNCEKAETISAREMLELKKSLGMG